MPRKICFVLTILFAVFLPIVYGKGQLYVGGDWLIPFYAEPLDRYLWQWVEIINGVFVSLNHYPFYALTRVFDSITSDVYIKGILFLLVIRITAVIGVYKLIRLIYEAEFNLNMVLVILFYLLSPAYYNGHVYWMIYAFIPWFFYFAVKIIKRGAITYLDVMAVSLVIFCASVDLPNPKYLFYFFVILAMVLAGAFFFKKVDIGFFLKNKLKIALFFCLSAYIIAPQLVFVLSYDPSAFTGTGVKKNYTNDAGSVMPDFGSATANRMVRLFHDGMNIETGLRNAYLSNPLITLANYFFVFLIGLYFLCNRGKTFYDYLLISLTLIFLFFAIGPNPPFGFIYEYVVGVTPLLAFLRTTAGAVLYLSLFYSLLLFAALQYFDKKVLTALFAGFLVVGSFPMINGDYYRNWSPVNPYIDKKEYGLRIPEAYFDVKGVLDSKKMDAKVFLPKGNVAYINTLWGYFGPTALYYYLYNLNFISNDRIESDLPKHNIGYVLMDNSIFDAREYPTGKKSLNRIAKSGFIEFLGVAKDKFLPCVYIPAKLVFTNSPLPYEVPINSAVLDPKDFTSSLSLTKTPVIEYKKISATKYRMIFHGIKDNFMFVFSESYHKSWSVFIQDYKKRERRDFEHLKSKYKILYANDSEQATPDELVGYVNKGWISSLGDGNEKATSHYHYHGTSKDLDFIERYNIDFISGNNYGTIQNNNLEEGGIFETNHLPRLPQEGLSHIKANYYANGWMADKNYIEHQFPELIVKNPDGSFDMEVVVEFLPQRYFYYSVIASLLALSITVWLFAFDWARRLWVKAVSFERA